MASKSYRVSEKNQEYRARTSRLSKTTLLEWGVYEISSYTSVLCIRLSTKWVICDSTNFYMKYSIADCESLILLLAVVLKNIKYFRFSPTMRLKEQQTMDKFNFLNGNISKMETA